MTRFGRVVLAVLALAPLVFGDTFVFDVAGNNAGGQINTAHITFSYDGIDTVSITVENTSPVQSGSPPNEGPQVSGFTFNTPANVTGVSNFTSPTGWAYLFDDGDIAPPDQVGTYDVCAETNGAIATCNGGGPVANRLVPGEVGDFTFTLTGTNLNALTAMSFLSIINPAGPSDPRASYFSVRFQSTGTGGDDSDVGVPTGDPLPPDQIPEPASVLLFGAMAGVYAMRKKHLAA
jgi:hypothetical protein